MDCKILNTLSPACFFKWFGEVCKIPHGSGNEKALIKFIEDYSRERGYNYITDAVGNVYIKIPAYPGYEEKESILFQAHLDMVCVKDEGVDFDFLNDPISLRIEDGRLCACGTTLGADNAVGIATMLAIGDDKAIPHPELEFLFTVGEEVGMTGIRCFDMSRIQSRRMINMDCGDSHVIAVSSLGNYSANIDRSFPLYERADAAAIRVKISGGLGGHPGLMCKHGRACAGNLMGRLLSSAAEHIFLASLETSDTSILTYCSAVVCTDKSNSAAVMELLTEAFGYLKSEYSVTDPNLKLEIEPADICNSLSFNNTREILELLCLIKTAPVKTDGERVITLSSIRSFYLRNGEFNLKFQVRFTSANDGEELFSSYVARAARSGFDAVLTDYCTCWNENKGSAFRQAFIDSHKSLFGYEPALEHVLGSVEIAPIVSALPQMDAVGIAPTARGAHTAAEHIILSETADYWSLILAVLKL